MNTSKSWKLQARMTSHLAELGEFLDPGQSMEVNYVGAPHDCYVVTFSEPITIDKFSASNELMLVAQPITDDEAGLLTVFPQFTQSNNELAS